MPNHQLTLRVRKLNQIHENIVTTMWAGHDVRVWFDNSEGRHAHADHERLRRFLYETFGAQRPTQEFAAQEIADRLPHVNAVEVRNAVEGVLVYNDWP